MNSISSRQRASIPAACLALSVMAAGLTAPAQTSGPVFTPGNLVVSRSLYTAQPSAVVVGQTLPPGCVANTTTKVTCGKATNDGTFPTVFNNSKPDGSFGITSPLILDEMSPTGTILNSITVPNNSTTSGDQLVTSFSSKSEEALHLSTDGKYLSFIDYVAPLSTVDTSNSNTPGVIDPTNPVPTSTYRAVATVNSLGQFSFTETNAYSGNNGRAAIYVNTGSTNGVPNNFFYTAGNAGNGGTPEPQGVVDGAGLQIIYPANATEASQNPGQPTPVASFNVSQVLPPGTTNPDKVGKDDNFRGLTLYNGILYATKGSGGNGVNTVYFVDTTGTACPNTGVGLPVAGAPLPTADLSPTYNATAGLANNMCILAGFPTAVNKLSPPVAYPFGIWFANATTLYVADEGDGVNTYSSVSNTYTDAANPAVNTGGLQKWIFSASLGKWMLAYTLNNGLNLGIPYAPASYPTGNNTLNGLPWAPATDGLRTIIGSVQGNRIQGYSAVLWGLTSTVSGSGDQGADPNKMFVITDRLTNTSPAVAAEEKFTDLRDAVGGEVLRGVSFTPGTTVTSN